MTILQLRNLPDVPLEAETITPDRFAGKSAAEIAALPVAVGNQRGCLGDFFAVSNTDESDIVVEGDCARVKMIGAGMTGGQIHVHGDVGMHLGSGMRGGTITVHGNAGDWAGAEMRGGLIRIRGNAGHCVGAAYRGSPKGMDRGVIIVDGNAGNEVGSTMRRGLIVVGGNSGDFTGVFMIAGTVVVFGEPGERCGAGLKRGAVVTFKPPHLLPSYRYACTYTPPFIGLLARYLQDKGVIFPEAWAAGRFRRYCGDLTALGKGEILVWEAA